MRFDISDPRFWFMVVLLLVAIVMGTYAILGDSSEADTKVLTGELVTVTSPHGYLGFVRFVDDTGAVCYATYRGGISCFVPE